MDQDLPLIIGAGPVGLAAALLLADRGVRPRIVDALPTPSLLSKALAVNPRTLRILQVVGVSEQMLRLGRPIRTAQFHSGGRTLARIELDQVGCEHPYMLALSQATSERLLAEALAARGVEVERGVKLEACRLGSDGRAHVELAVPSGEVERASTDWLIATDGAHSTVRHELGLAFEGEASSAPWRLADARLETTLDESAAHVLLLERGFGFMLRVVTGDEAPGERPLWRVVSNLADPVGQMRAIGVVTSAETPQWESEFHVAHRLIETMQRGPVLFAGDAAHLHSPVGARGMNLGIEDAWAIAELASRGELDRYDAARRMVDRSVVRRVRRITRIAAGHSPATRALRAIAARLLPIVPVARHRMRSTVMGLDHPLAV